MNINNMTIHMPHQLFINGEFVDAEGGKTYKTINPTTGQVEWNDSLALIKTPSVCCWDTKAVDDFLYTELLFENDSQNPVDLKLITQVRCD